VEIVGDEPRQAELGAFYETLLQDIIPAPTRSERRCKKDNMERFERNRAKILPILDTLYGIQTVRAIALESRKRDWDKTNVTCHMLSIT
jgi:hypothetical protein